MSKKKQTIYDPVVEGTLITRSFEKTEELIKKHLLDIFSYNTGGQLTGYPSYNIQSSKNAKSAVDELLKRLKNSKSNLYQVMSALYNIPAQAQKDSWRKNELSTFTTDLIKTKVPSHLVFFAWESTAMQSQQLAARVADADFEKQEKLVQENEALKLRNRTLIISGKAAQKQIRHLTFHQTRVNQSELNISAVSAVKGTRGNEVFKMKNVMKPSKLIALTATQQGLESMVGVEEKPIAKCITDIQFLLLKDVLHDKEVTIWLRTATYNMLFGVASLDGKNIEGMMPLLEKLKDENCKDKILNLFKEAKESNKDASMGQTLDEVLKEWKEKVPALYDLSPYDIHIVTHILNFAAMQAKALSEDKLPVLLARSSKSPKENIRNMHDVVKTIYQIYKQGLFFSANGAAVFNEFRMSHQMYFKKFWDFLRLVGREAYKSKDDLAELSSLKNYTAEYADFIEKEYNQLRDGRNSQITTEIHGNAVSVLDV